MTNLPRNQEAEEAVVGAILYAGRSALHAVMGLLAAADFYHPTLRAIFVACVALDDALTPITILTVSDRMTHDGTAGTLVAYGGPAYLAELSSRITIVDTIAVHADLIREAALRRRLYEIGCRLQQQVIAGQDDVEAILGAAQSDLAGASGGASSRSVDVGTDFDEEFRAIGERVRTPGAPQGILSGFGELDYLTNGFRPGDLVIVAARPSMGKTSLIMQITDRAAWNSHPALLFSAEMDRVSIRQRRLSIEGRIDSNAIRTGCLSQQQMRTLEVLRFRWKNVPLRTNDTACPSLPYLRSEAYRWRSDPRLNFTLPGVIGIDYLQLIRGTDRGRQHSREQEIAEITRALKALAKELGVVVVVGSQLNRDLEKRANKRPVLSDLRESGAIEQDADVVLFIYRDEMYDPKTADPGIAEIIVGKQRNGPLGTVRLAFLNQYTRFENFAARRP
jgi:replicative DNA helicase